MNYDDKEELWYVSKDDMLNAFTDVLVKIFRKTFSGKKIFNAYNIIRQNFLTICETEGYLSYIFGQDYIFYLDEDNEYCPSYHLKDEVIDNVMNVLGVEDVDIKDIINFN